MHERTGTLSMIATARELAREAEAIAPILSDYAKRFARIGARGLRAAGVGLDAFLDEFDGDGAAEEMIES